MVQITQSQEVIAESDAAWGATEAPSRLSRNLPWISFSFSIIFDSNSQPYLFTFIIFKSFYHVLWSPQRTKGPGTRKDVIKRVKHQACLSVLQRAITSYLKSIRSLLCSGVASNILQSKSPFHLNLSVDFWVMRTFLS